MQIPIRIGRVAAATLLFPGHEVPAVAASEMISVFAPVLNKTFMKKVLHAIIVIIYAPRFSHAYVSKLSENRDTKYQQAEVCTMLLFFLTYLLNNY
jgi:hypothetical protein